MATTQEQTRPVSEPSPQGTLSELEEIGTISGHQVHPRGDTVAYVSVHPNCNIAVGDRVSLGAIALGDTERPSIQVRSLCLGQRNVQKVTGQAIATLPVQPDNALPPTNAPVFRLPAC
ncbi:hypothetical protein KJ782_03295 [Patescibacteria group bacterium]|nr:hypothetical protein [Patescibacteria group bacterium]